MKESLESRLGMFFAFAIIATLIILEFVGGFAFLKRGYHLHAYFKNVQELKSGDPVKMAGVQVGRVESINLDVTNSMADVILDLDRGVDVKTDSKARINFTGLMAENFVALDFGSPNGVRAEDNATIKTLEQPDLSMLMTRLDNAASGLENLTRSFSGDKIDSLLGPLTDFLKNNQANLTATIANLKTTSDRIVQGQGTVGKLINEDTLYTTALTTVSNLQDTATNVQDIAGEARDLLSNANYTVTQINTGHGTLGKLLTDDTLYNEATGSLTNAHQILLKINHGQGSVGKLINDDTILKNIQLTMQKIDKATESLEDTGPISILGTMVSSLF
jgi:phospholipid/cholesterol/gamma-HCH transport system substrate-binding protein